MIEAFRLTKSFGPRVALHGIDLSIDRGDLVTLIGPNGAGKTTLLRILATLARPTSGRVRIAGMDPARAGEQVRRCLGFLSHGTLLYDDLTAEQNLRFYARLYDMAVGSEACTARIGDLLRRVGLESRRHDQVRTFSRGMKQRLAVARAVLHEPKILLLDEPYTGLDAQAVDVLTELLLQVAGEGCGILLATHRLTRGLTIGKRVLVLHRGRLVYDQPRKAVPSHTFAELYRTVTA